MTKALVLILVSVAEPALAGTQTDLDRLSWLAGCWIRDGSERVVEEQWMAPRGTTLHGMSRTVSKKDGRTIEFEATVIALAADGRLTYTAKPSGQPEATFTAIEVTDSTVVFENPAHDFPQRVGYRREADGGLTGWIEGRMSADSPVKRIPFPYSRARCP